MKNSEQITPGEIRKIRRAFGKLRHRKLWTSHTKGGVASVEITNIGNGWHVHLHAVIDCKWLAVKTPAPRPREDHLAIKEKCIRAARELESVWSRLLGQPTSSVLVKRAYRGTISKEVVKYTVTPEALLNFSEPIGDMIRAIDSTRMMTTFGTAHGQVIKDVRLEAKALLKEKAAEWRAARLPECKCGCEEWMPENLATTSHMERRYHLAEKPNFSPKRIFCEAG